MEQETRKTGLLDIKGVVIQKGPVYTRGCYAAYVGYLMNKNDSDIPHYLIINTAHNVVESASAVLHNARVMTDQLWDMLSEQDASLQATGELPKNGPDHSFN